MKPPQAFYDFTLQLHQDLDLVYPGWSSEASDARRELYEDFRQGFGDRSVAKLSAYFGLLLNDEYADLEAIWTKESRADWLFERQGIRRLLEDFRAWASAS
ncbi:hypothetical protein Ga0609869_003133 [Rhodovulum iodosum]|uniref:CdiI immunity protein domain-containing protein n=1 Tax=Rhodovulum iodosum TaxID=68291 RepID=A0ABV3XWS0_9RHOB|nr:hypothetical protein [Rhodovulum robiginosum]RSK34179.1 hypothetical protein EJA01_08630 [Rhodovulum robiginosum]